MCVYICEKVFLRLYIYDNFCYCTIDLVIFLLIENFRPSNSTVFYFFTLFVYFLRALILFEFPYTKPLYEFQIGSLAEVHRKINNTDKKRN